MNECVDKAETSKLAATLDETTGAADAKNDRPASGTTTNAVTVSATSTTVITSTSAATAAAATTAAATAATTNDALPPAEALWNQFLKNISQQSYSSRCKYPNPEVPEFYPRSATIARAPVASASASSSSNSNSCINISSVSATSCTASSEQQKNIVNATAAVQNVRFFNKSELVKRFTSADLADLASLRTTTAAAAAFTDKTNPMQAALTRYYWSFHDVSSEYIPRCLNFSPDTVAATSAQPKFANPAIEYGDACAKNAYTSAVIPAKTVPELLAELSTKNQQLAHLNHVVKALLEEIWKINELSTRHKNREQWKSDVGFAIHEFLKPAAELGFHCDDCCNHLKEFVSRVTKQLEHRMAKQHAQYKANFVDTVLSVVESSLRTLTRSPDVDFKSKLIKRDVYTQTTMTTMTTTATHQEYVEVRAGRTDAGSSTSSCRRSSSRIDAARRNKLQITKVYRNRNFYKCYDVGPAATTTAAAVTTATDMGKEQWFSTTAAATIPCSRGEKLTNGGARGGGSRGRGAGGRSAGGRNAGGRNAGGRGAGSGGARSVRYAAPKLYAFPPAQQSYGDESAPNLINPIQLIHQKYKNLNCRLEGIPDKNLVKFSYIVNGREYSAVASTKKEAQYHCAWHVLGATSQE